MKDGVCVCLCDRKRRKDGQMSSNLDKYSIYHKRTNGWERMNKRNLEVKLRKSEKTGKKEKNKAIKRQGRRGLCMC